MLRDKDQINKKKCPMLAKKKSTMYMNCTMYLIDVSHHVTKPCTEHTYMYM